MNDRLLQEEERIADECPICEGPFKDPVVTKCKHYFCESCALEAAKKSRKCKECGTPHGGSFNAARGWSLLDFKISELRAKLKDGGTTKRRRLEEEEDKATKLSESEGEEEEIVDDLEEDTKMETLDDKPPPPPVDKGENLIDSTFFREERRRGRRQAEEGPEAGMPAARPTEEASEGGRHTWKRRSQPQSRRCPVFPPPLILVCVLFFGDKVFLAIRGSVRIDWIFISSVPMSAWCFAFGLKERPSGVECLRIPMRSNG